jgi:hypothetical protein
MTQKNSPDERKPALQEEMLGGNAGVSVPICQP